MRSATGLRFGRITRPPQESRNPPEIVPPLSSYGQPSPLRQLVATSNEGLAAARARDQRRGRPPLMTPEKVAYRPPSARRARTLAAFHRELLKICSTDVA
jgi:hypothetical protein